MMSRLEELSSGELGARGSCELRDSLTEFGPATLSEMVVPAQRWRKEADCSEPGCDPPLSSSHHPEMMGRLEVPCTSDRSGARGGGELSYSGFSSGPSRRSEMVFSRFADLAVHLTVVGPCSSRHARGSALFDEVDRWRSIQTRRASSEEGATSDCNWSQSLGEPIGDSAAPAAAAQPEADAEQSSGPAPGAPSAQVEVTTPAPPDVIEETLSDETLLGPVRCAACSATAQRTDAVGWVAGEQAGGDEVGEAEVASERDGSSRRRARLALMGDRPFLRHRLPGITLIGHPLWSQARRGAISFLVYMLRRIRERMPSWQPGERLPWLCRPPSHPRCRYGQSLAGEAEFEAQAALASGELDWLRSHVDLLTRLRSGEPPVYLDLFCCAGGSSEGARRMGFAVHGVDLQSQPSYVAKFGERCFSEGSALSRELLRYLVRRHRPTLIGASPPCEGSSTATFGNVPSAAPRLIAATRDALQETGSRYFIENTRGASSELRDPLMLRGFMFGLRTDRPRLFERGGGLEVAASTVLQRPARLLEEGSCLGSLARYARLDSFGRRFQVPCCAGNIHTVVGESPKGGLEAAAAAMGLDVGHMPFSHMRKALPPAYVSFLAGSAALDSLRRDYGLPVLSFSQAQADLPAARRQLQHWRRGAGGQSPSLGLALTPPSGEPVGSGRERQPKCSPIGHAEASNAPEFARAQCLVEGGAGESPPPTAEAAVPGVVRLSEESFREIEYTVGGGFTQSVQGAGAVDWLTSYSGGRRFMPTEVYGGTLASEVTLVVAASSAAAALGASIDTAVSGVPGTRVTLVCMVADVETWRAALGSTRADQVWAGADQWVALSCGHRVAPPRAFLDHAAVADHMDAVDRGVGALPKGWKAGVSWSPMPPHDPGAWRGRGMPADVEAMMTDGVQVDLFSSGLGPTADRGAEEGQYPFQDMEHFVRGVSECDRAIAAGHLVPVPLEHVAEALAAAPAHPWTVVHQSEDKWRAAQDYSRFTNRRVGSKPFTLPTVTDVSRVVGPDSHFAKYDLRDGFWSVPVAERSRRYLMVRHPATGQLLWCTSLPFGYALSPLHFCAVTEAVADEIRRRVAGRGIHTFVFVDDYLCVGDTEELTAEGMRVMEAVFAEFGLPWALHKRRGPARVMEFLGHLLVNTHELSCIGLTERRQARVSEMIAGWLLRRPAPGGEPAHADPLELAQLLGHLVFASEVIPHGRTFMQALLRQFQGLEVDWMRGTVRYARMGGPARRVSLSHDFWLDLLWFQSSRTASR